MATTKKEHTLSSHGSPYKWTRRRISVYTRIGPGDLPHRVLAPVASVFGSLAVHPAVIVEHKVPNPDDPLSWEVVFGHSQKLGDVGVQRRWSITHWPTGLRFSKGAPEFNGYPTLRGAREVASTIAWEFREVFDAVPKTGSHDAMVSALQSHPHYDDMIARLRFLEKRYGGEKLHPDLLPKPRKEP